MLQNTSKTISFKKIMVYKTLPGAVGGGGGGGGRGGSGSWPNIHTYFYMKILIFLY